MLLTARILVASKAGVPYEIGLRRRANSSRTFIKPTQKSRDSGVKHKHAPIKAVLEGKRVVVVDDSIVRGTNASKLVRMIRETGAVEVHLRIACPPAISACYYGVDIQSSEELIATGKTVEEIRQLIGCDSLAFLSMENLKNSLGNGFCYGCLTKDYPIPPCDE
ncbi:hypothetical protein IFM89_037973 [Coptis chinensis]|uniref:Amidophosphoribosyltransferase n=1 Tax=Coptis chinensis TaxID=261450 RepID=A0A835M2W4_9MAGN|nr:hypothetical protein IFM89_037973 [Coptis chinensis]